MVPQHCVVKAVVVIFMLETVRDVVSKENDPLAVLPVLNVTFSSVKVTTSARAAVAPESNNSTPPAMVAATQLNL